MCLKWSLKEIIKHGMKDSKGINGIQDKTRRKGQRSNDVFMTGILSTNLICLTLAHLQLFLPDVINFLCAQNV